MSHIPNPRQYQSILADLPEESAVFIVSALSNPTDIIEAHLFVDRAAAKEWKAAQPDPYQFIVEVYTVMRKNGTAYLRPGEPDMRHPVAARVDIARSAAA